MTRTILASCTWAASEFCSGAIYETACTLIERFGNRTLNGSNSRSRTISFGEAVTRAKRYGIGLGLFVQAVLDGEITPCGRNSRKGISGFLFLAEQINTFGLNKLRLREGEVYCLREAATVLGVGEMTAFFLVKKGLIQAQIKAGAKGMGHLVTEDELKHFSVSYFVLTNQIVRELDTTTSYINKLLAQQGIRPISGKSVDGGYSYVYRQSDLKRIDLRELVLNSRHKKYKKRTGPSTFYLEIVADHLGVNNQGAQQLVKAGVIKPYRGRTRKRRDRKKYYVPYYVVEKCKNFKIEYTSLISTEVAASMLGVCSGTLCQSVKEGRIKTAWEKESNRQFYFLKEDIESIVKSKTCLIASCESAAILGVSVATLRLMVVSGKLKPVSGPGIDGASKRLYLRNDVETLRRDKQPT